MDEAMQERMRTFDEQYARIFPVRMALIGGEYLGMVDAGVGLTKHRVRWPDGRVQVGYAVGIVQAWDAWVEAADIRALT